jgi:hypothetical protein
MSRVAAREGRRQQALLTGHLTVNYQGTRAQEAALVASHWLPERKPMPARIHFIDDRESSIEINYDGECAKPGWYWQTYVKAKPLGVGAGPFPTREEAEADMRQYLEAPIDVS